MKLAHIFSFLPLALADVPISCPYSSTLGTWVFAVGRSGRSQKLVAQCGLDNLGTVTQTYTFKLEEKNKVTNLETGSTGTYTIVSSQGFEISIDGRKWWAYYYFDEFHSYNNDCSRTKVGYQRDDLMTSWNCIQGAKIAELDGSPVVGLTGQKQDNQSIWDHQTLSKQFVENERKVAQINQKAKTWTAKPYFKHEKYTIGEMQARQGREKMDMRDNDQQTYEEKLETARNFQFPAGAPTNWDWRNVNGKRFDSPVWDQAGCGSCFAFASKSFMEAMVRIQTTNQKQPIFSVQEMITCGAEENYNQGCSGGFAYLVAGKEMYERGFVEESCDPENLSYNYQSTKCPQTAESCHRWYSTEYEYLGGFYGAATTEMMVEHLYKKGPLSVGIAVPSDFRSYANGIYVSTMNRKPVDPNNWDPLEPTGHAVVIVGYGRCPETITADTADQVCLPGNENLPYWIVKNSWGDDWAIDGYINVLMAVDEIYIESKPVTATPIGHY